MRRSQYHLTKLGVLLTNVQTRYYLDGAAFSSLFSIDQSKLSAIKHGYAKLPEGFMQKFVKIFKLTQDEQLMLVDILQHQVKVKSSTRVAVKAISRKQSGYSNSLLT